MLSVILQKNRNSREMSANYTRAMPHPSTLPTFLEMCTRSFCLFSSRPSTGNNTAKGKSGHAWARVRGGKGVVCWRASTFMQCRVLGAKRHLRDEFVGVVVVVDLVSHFLHG